MDEEKFLKQLETESEQIENQTRINTELFNMLASIEGEGGGGLTKTAVKYNGSTKPVVSIIDNLNGSANAYDILSANQGKKLNEDKVNKNGDILTGPLTLNANNSLLLPINSQFLSVDSADSGSEKLIFKTEENKLLFGSSFYDIAFQGKSFSVSTDIKEGNSLLKDKYIQKTAIINDVTTGGADKVLSAEQGKVLNAAIVANQADIIEKLKSYANGFSITKDDTNFIYNFNILNGEDILATANIDLPLETVVTNGRYDAVTKEIVLILQNNAEIKISIGSIINGLATTENFNTLDNKIAQETEKRINEDNKKLDKVGGTISGDLTIAGDLTVQGKQTILDTETVSTKDNIISLATGRSETTPITIPVGLEVKNYDGKNPNNALQLVIDDKGTALVGNVIYEVDGSIKPENNKLQPLATRDIESNMKDQYLVKWDATSASLKTSKVNIDQAYLPLTGGIMTGPITIGAGDGRGLLIPRNEEGTPVGNINIAGTNQTVLGFYDGNYILGSNAYNTTIRGGQTYITGSNLDIGNIGNSGLIAKGISTNTDYTTIHTTTNRALFLQEGSSGIVNIGGTPSTTTAQDMSAKLIVNGDIKEGEKLLSEKYQPKGDYYTKTEVNDQLNLKVDKTAIIDIAHGGTGGNTADAAILNFANEIGSWSGENLIETERILVTNTQGAGTYNFKDLWDKYFKNRVEGKIVNNLTSTSTTEALSAAQGKWLEENKQSKGNYVTLDTTQIVSATKTFTNNITFGTYIPYTRKIDDPPLHSKKITTHETNAEFTSMFIATTAGDWFYGIDKNDEYTIKSSFPGWGNSSDTYSETLEYEIGKGNSCLSYLFDWSYTSNWKVLPEKITQTTPAIIEITRNQGITATDVLRLVITGWRNGGSDSYSGYLDDYKIEILSQDENDPGWITVVDRKNASDSIGSNLIYALDLNHYHYIKGIRLIITKAHVKENGNKVIGITTLQLRDYRPSLPFHDGLGVVSKRGGTYLGQITAPGYKIKNSDNNSIILAGGGTKLISDFASKTYVDQQFNTKQPKGDYVTYEQKNNVSILGTAKTIYKYLKDPIFAPSGLIMGGTAQQAGLTTRGICGVNPPNEDTGACTKADLFINYDGDNTYRSGRQLILQAGIAGEHYGNNLYQYAAARGDAVKGWVENYAFPKTVKFRVEKGMLIASY